MRLPRVKSAIFLPQLYSYVATVVLTTVGVSVDVKQISDGVSVCSSLILLLSVQQNSLIIRIVDLVKQVYTINNFIMFYAILRTHQYTSVYYNC